MTDFLFARPTFLSGMGAVLDLGGTMEMFNESSSPEEADSLAIMNDWVSVGNNLRSAIAQAVLA